MYIVYFAQTNLPNDKSHSVQILNNARMMAEHGVEIDLYVRKLRGTAEEVLAAYGLTPHPNLKLMALPCQKGRPGRWHGRRFWWHIWKLMLGHALRGRKPIYYSRGTAKILEMLCKMAPLAKLLGRPIYYEVHNIQYLDLFENHAGRYGKGEELERYITERRNLEARVYRHLSGIMTLTRRLENLLHRDFDVQCPILITPSGATPPTQTPAPIGGRPHAITYVGNLYAFNGVQVLIEAMQYLPNEHLTVVGGGSDQDIARCRDLIAKLGLEDRVTMKGFVPHHEALEIMRQSKTLLVPLLESGKDDRVSWISPGKMFEYMASGGAIVCSDIPSLTEIIQHESNGLTCKPNDPRALADTLARLLSAPDLAQRLADQAFIDLQKYTFQTRVSRILAFIEKHTPSK